MNKTDMEEIKRIFEEEAKALATIVDRYRQTNDLSGMREVGTVLARIQIGQGIFSLVAGMLSSMDVRISGATFDEIDAYASSITDHLVEEVTAHVNKCIRKGKSDESRR